MERGRFKNGTRMTGDKRRCSKMMMLVDQSCRECDGRIQCDCLSQY
jgi:hypothetical protein